MLDIQYYTLKMDDELKGASEYIQRAINCKKSKPDHAKLYASMSDGELEHASNLMKMFEDDYAKCTSVLDTIPDIYLSIHNSLSQMYTDSVARVKCMHQLFDNK